MIMEFWKEKEEQLKRLMQVMSWLVLAHQDYKLNRESKWEKKFVEWFFEEDGRNPTWLIECGFYLTKFSQDTVDFFVQYLLGNREIQRSIVWAFAYYNNSKTYGAMSGKGFELFGLSNPFEDLVKMCYVCRNYLLNGVVSDNMIRLFPKHKSRKSLLERLSISSNGHTIYYNDNPMLTAELNRPFPPIPFERIAAGDWPFDNEGNLIEAKPSGEPEQANATAEASTPTNSVKVEAVASDDTRSEGEPQQTQQPVGEPQQVKADAPSAVKADAPASTQPKRRGRPKANDNIKDFVRVLNPDDFLEKLGRLISDANTPTEAIGYILAAVDLHYFSRKPPYACLKTDFGNVIKKTTYNNSDIDDWANKSYTFKQLKAEIGEWNLIAK